MWGNNKTKMMQPDIVVCLFIICIGNWNLDLLMQVYRLYMIIDKQGTVVTLYTSRCVQYYIKMTNHPFSSKLWWCVTSPLLWSYCYGPSDPPCQKRPHCQYWCSMWLLTSASLVFVERLASCSSPAWAVATSPERQPTWNVNLKELKQ